MLFPSSSSPFEQPAGQPLPPARLRLLAAAMAAPGRPTARPALPAAPAANGFIPSRFAGLAVALEHAARLGQDVMALYAHLARGAETQAYALPLYRIAQRATEDAVGAAIRPFEPAPFLTACAQIAAAFQARTGVGALTDLLAAADPVGGAALYDYLSALAVDHAIDEEPLDPDAGQTNPDYPLWEAVDEGVQSLGVIADRQAARFPGAYGTIYETFVTIAPGAAHPDHEVPLHYLTDPAEVPGIADRVVAEWIGCGWDPMDAARMGELILKRYAPPAQS